MLLQALRVTNSRGSLLDLPLEDTSSGFFVKEIEGLDPVKATLVSSSFANQDGAQYHSSRREARNIRIKLGLQPDYALMDVKELRTQLYDFFMPKTRAMLYFDMFDRHTESVLDQSLQLEIAGRIETFETPLFTKDPEVDISIMCFDPDFVDPNGVLFEGMSTDDLTEETLSYPGNIETGVVFTIRPDRSLDEFTIYHRPPDEMLHTVNFSYPLLAGDVLRISSVYGEKGVVLTRGGVETSLLYSVSPQSSWLELQPGDNILRVHATGLPVPFDISYTTKYGGL